MALNPTFASASVNPSQSIGSDASAPQQGALPMGQSNLAQTQDAGTAGFSGLGGQSNQPQYTMPLNQPSPPNNGQLTFDSYGVPSGSENYQPPQQDISGFDSSGRYVGANMPNGGYNPFGNYLGDPAKQVIGPEPFSFSNYTAPKEPLVPMIPNFNQSYYQSPQYQSYLNNMPQYTTDDHVMMPFGGYGSGSIASLQNQSYEDFLKNPSMAQQPNIQEEFGVPNPLDNQNSGQGAMFQRDIFMQPYENNFGFDATGYQNDLENYVANKATGATFDKEMSSYFPSQQAYQNYVDYAKTAGPKYTTQDLQTAMRNPEFDSGYYRNANVVDDQGNPLSIDAKQQLMQTFYNQAQQPNYALQPPTELVGQLPQQSLQQDPPSRYTYFGNDKTDYSQLGLSQTALDSLNMMRQAPDMGQFYYDTQTKTFGQGVGHPPPNIPGQRRYTGKTGIPLELMNKLGTGELIDFSPYVQYTEGTPLPPSTLQDVTQLPMPEQQPTINSTPTQRNPLTPTATPTGTTPMATNPLSTYATTPTTGSTPAPTLNATPGATSSGSFGQGGVLPNVTTTQQQVTAAPTFYTDYLNQLATQGGQAAQNAQYVGAQPLQEQAFNLASQNVGNYQPTLQNAINLASSVGNSNLAQAIGDVGQANIARNLAPQATAGIVGSGQFGSKRGAQALGDVIANAQLGLTAQQQQAKEL